MQPLISTYQSGYPLHVSLEDSFGDVSSRQLPTTKESSAESLGCSACGCNRVEFHIDVTLGVSDDLAQSLAG